MAENNGEVSGVFKALTKQELDHINNELGAIKKAVAALPCAAQASKIAVLEDRLRRNGNNGNGGLNLKDAKTVGALFLILVAVFTSLFTAFKPNGHAEVAQFRSDLKTMGATLDRLTALPVQDRGLRFSLPPDGTTKTLPGVAK